MTLQAIVALIVAVFFLAIKPGAGMAMVISRSLSQGMTGCFTFLLGFNFILMCYLGLVLSGLYLVDADLIFISILIKVLAAVYLINMGIQGFNKLDIPLKVEKIEGQNFFENISSAMVLTLSNPLIVLFYAGILPTILDVNVIGWRDVVVIASVIMGIETGVVLLYCLPIIFFRHKVSQNILGKIRFVSSVMIIFVGLYIGYSALPAKDLLSVF